MDTNITYKGLSDVPSDYACPDGDLASMQGLVNDGTGLRASLPPTVLFMLPVHCRVAHIHETSGHKHWIVEHADDGGSTTYVWLDAAATEDAAGAMVRPDYEHNTIITIGKEVTVHGINAIGNTLMILTSEGVQYILWKDSRYNVLGTHMPDLPISFGLRCHVDATVTSDINEISTGSGTASYTHDGDKWAIPTEAKSVLNNGVWGCVNKWVADRVTKLGRFHQPFLVRYAYRLYDDSLTMHSAPVLMVPSTGVNPVVTLSERQNQLYIANSGSFREQYWAQAHGVTAELDYAMHGAAECYAQLREWRDIIKGIEIYVSAPLYNYDQSKDVDALWYYNITDKRGHIMSEDDMCGNCIGRNPADEEYHLWQVRGELTAQGRSLSAGQCLFAELPARNEDDRKKAIAECSTFYLLKSFSLEEEFYFAEERTVINIKEDYLGSLVARQQMSDDYDSHDKLVPRYSYAYNQRLNLANIKKELWNDYNPIAMLAHTDGCGTMQRTGRAANSQYSIYFCIESGGRTITVKGVGEGYFRHAGADAAGRTGSTEPTQCIHYLYYPNPNCTKAIVEVETDGVKTWYEFPMHTHEFLTGSVWCGAFTTYRSETVKPEPSSDLSTDIYGKIYTSEAGNPYLFPLGNINTIGDGSVLGIASATRALSEGQFGQHPLYAFTTDGIWALQVSSTGTYAAIQPVSRDVCINPGSITQIDSGVLFATERGIMLISGSELKVISGTLNSEWDNFDPTSLPGLEAMLKDHGVSAANYDLRKELKTLRMLYDYSNSEVIVYGGSPIALILSLKSQCWGASINYIDSTVNSYPLAIANGNRKTDNGTVGTVLDYSHRNVEARVPGYLVTRPLKLGGADVLKTLRGVIQRGVLYKDSADHVAQALWGSRDLQHWQRIFSSRDRYLRGFSGTPYKYYRLAVLTGMDATETLAAATVTMEPKETNKQR